MHLKCLRVTGDVPLLGLLILRVLRGEVGENISSLVGGRTRSDTENGPGAGLDLCPSPNGHYVRSL